MFTCADQSNNGQLDVITGLAVITGSCTSRSFEEEERGKEKER